MPSAWDFDPKLWGLPVDADPDVDMGDAASALGGTDFTQFAGANRSMRLPPAAPGRSGYVDPLSLAIGAGQEAFGGRDPREILDDILWVGGGGPFVDKLLEQYTGVPATSARANENLSGLLGSKQASLGGTALLAALAALPGARYLGKGLGRAARWIKPGTSAAQRVRKMTETGGNVARAARTAEEALTGVGRPTARSMEAAIAGAGAARAAGAAAPAATAAARTASAGLGSKVKSALGWVGNRFRRGGAGAAAPAGMGGKIARMVGVGLPAWWLASEGVDYANERWGKGKIQREERRKDISLANEAEQRKLSLERDMLREQQARSLMVTPDTMMQYRLAQEQIQSQERMAQMQVLAQLAQAASSAPMPGEATLSQALRMFGQ